ncbi:MAG TPA: HDIG domain-containing protein, partial [Thermodesulfobacteriota bacterium]|nr:HDIG domain-containing protein [Thermodesulfobacteriota bacterium]
MVPEAGECLLLLKRFDVPANVVEHSRMVCRVATRLATELNSCGERLDLAKVEAGALLHDIA